VFLRVRVYIHPVYFFFGKRKHVYAKGALSLVSSPQLP
jgi:hypothetical protein